jgi:hypothetical protein
MSTPTYLGAAQPAPSNGNGLLGWLGSYLSGSGTPAYVGAGQPAATNNGSLLRPATPAYAAAPVRAPIAEPESLAVAPPEAVAPASYAEGCPIDPAALAAGHIAIVIPRNCAPTETAT